MKNLTLFFTTWQKIWGLRELFQQGALPQAVRLYDKAVQRSWGDSA